jgi:hypothetical protein
VVRARCGARIYARIVGERIEGGEALVEACPAGET